MPRPDEESVETGMSGDLSAPFALTVESVEAGFGFLQKILLTKETTVRFFL